MSGEEVIERLNDLEKISNHNNLTDDEALGIAFLPMFAQNKIHDITEKLLICLGKILP